MARFLFATTLAVAWLSLTGCTNPAGSDDWDLAEAGQAVETSNGLSVNGAVMDLLADPTSGDESRKILAYLVSCALPTGEEFSLTIDGHVYRFEGAIGVAPEWGGSQGSCDADCQSWVSSCVLARTNFAGDAVPVSLRGPLDALASDEQERSDFVAMEGAYFADLFSSPPKWLACTAHGSNLIERVCGPSIESCPVEVVGDCDDYFPFGGSPTPRCGIPDTTEGYYPDCRDDEGNVYAGSMTVFRQCGNGVCDVTESPQICPQDCF
jgi:hypothetical protein